jgi:hypothetical protein
MDKIFYKGLWKKCCGRGEVVERGPYYFCIFGWERDCVGVDFLLSG